MKKLQPIRMCITCRNRYPQHTLIRLTQKDKDVIPSNGESRSFYICIICGKNEKKIKGLVKRFRQDEEQFSKLLKELMKNG